MARRLTRRRFLQAWGALGLASPFLRLPWLRGGTPVREKGKRPLILCSRGSEWGSKVLSPGWEILVRGGDLLDAVVASANVVELDPEDVTVGYGGLPNEEGVVQLDSSIMDGRTHNCGAVAALEGIKTPSKVARLVMERTDHMLLVGEGAQRFAIAHGFQVENLLTEKARREWLQWKETLSDEDDWLPPPEGEEPRDRTEGTINILALNAQGELAGLTTTSGLSYKIPGRVGDSPIIGAGLYVDGAIGAAGATGRGEEVIRTCGSFRVVQNMGRGMSPQEACEEACRFIVKVNERAGTAVTFNDKFVALNKDGDVGCGSIRPVRGGRPAYSIQSEDGFKALRGSVILE